MKSACADSNRKGEPAEAGFVFQHGI